MVYELAIVVAAWGIANVVFRAFEAHVPWTKRLVKFAVLFLMLALIRYRAGRLWFYLSISTLTAGIVVLHGWWFHYRHGVHWRTAEPRDRYLRLIGKAPATPDGPS